MRSEKEIKEKIKQLKALRNPIFDKQCPMCRLTNNEIVDTNIAALEWALK